MRIYANNHITVVIYLLGSNYKNQKIDSNAPLLVVDSCNNIPAAAHIAKRPFLTSLTAKSFLEASLVPNLSGLNPNSPGARSPDFLPSVTATPEITEF